MSTINQLLKELSDLDIDVILCAKTVKINAPKGILTRELIERIRERKAEILSAKNTHPHMISSEKDRHHRHDRHQGARCAVPVPSRFPQSPHCWHPETAELIHWFIEEGQHRIPTKPFHLAPWMEVVDPEEFKKSLHFYISLGPDWITNRNGKLHEDLRLLKEKFTT